jgi:hypothetical protein
MHFEDKNLKECFAIERKLVIYIPEDRSAFVFRMNQPISPLLLGIIEPQDYGSKILPIVRNYLPIEKA